MAYKTKQNKAFKSGIKLGLDFFYKAVTGIAACLMIAMFFMVIKDLEAIQDEAYTQGFYDGKMFQDQLSKEPTNLDLLLTDMTNESQWH